ncbi:CRISPR-associated endonuclease Cas2 [Mycoplasma marinum]|uniref:CRISPR-associated endoribonuclease Cas2 n=1 Tax=Mycoplasma marinum TaxID=1937190 RepID=A0A4V2NHV7_9MOLU|nr:CRISPR-associated endonuclease Cas2 [Mycoplasma marinum]TCG10298.1 CRISPR-associated endonuclease Cas2 [Mycoplasma marinum]
MRLILMYDLYGNDEEGQKVYTKFHKGIISRGFIMMQYSVYIKAINTPTKRDYEIKAIQKIVPKNGNIRILTVTDKQYQNMSFLRGGKKINETINNELRRVKIKYEI